MNSLLRYAVVIEELDDGTVVEYNDGDVVYGSWEDDLERRTNNGVTMWGRRLLKVPE